MHFSRLVLCLALFASTAGFAQDFENPPLVPAEEPAAPPAPQGEIIPGERRERPWSPARFAGRLLLQPPVGLLAGAVGGFAGAIPGFIIGILACDGPPYRGPCLDNYTLTGFGITSTLGAGLGVMGIGYVLGGEARTSAVMAGAAAGSAFGVALMVFSANSSLKDIAPYLVVGPALGATLLYTLSDAFFPEPARAIAPTRKVDPEDEYVQVLPMLTPTRTGGVLAGLVGRF